MKLSPNDFACVWKILLQGCFPVLPIVSLGIVAGKQALLRIAGQHLNSLKLWFVWRSADLELHASPLWWQHHASSVLAFETRYSLNLMF